jgi:hypothetical protein
MKENVFNRTTASTNPIIVVTFMRSGTHLTMDLIRKQFDIGGYKYPGEALDALYLPLDTIAMPQADSWRKVFSKINRFRRPIFKSHYLTNDLSEFEADHPAFRSWLLEKGTWIYVIRDPAKVMASLYQFNLGFQAIEDVDDWLLTQARNWVRHVESWTASGPGTHVLKFEDIVTKPQTALGQLSEILHMECRAKLPYLPKRLNSIWKGRFLRFLATTSETTEILTGTKPINMSYLCRPDTIATFNDMTADLRQQYSYSPLS